MSDNLKTWPDRIWLQHSEDGYPVPAYKVETDEITWCEDKQYDCDIEYARADRIAELERQLAELRQPTAQQVEDAKCRVRYEYLKRTTTAIRNSETGQREECTPEQFEAAIDAALQAGKEKEHGN